MTAAASVSAISTSWNEHHEQERQRSTRESPLASPTFSSTLSPNTQLGVSEGFRPIASQPAASASYFVNNSHHSSQTSSSNAVHDEPLALQQLASISLVESLASPFTKVAVEEGFLPLTSMLAGSCCSSEGSPTHQGPTAADQLEKTMPPSQRPPRGPLRRKWTPTSSPPPAPVFGQQASTGSTPPVMSPHTAVGVKEGFIPLARLPTLASNSNSSEGLSGSHGL